MPPINFWRNNVILCGWHADFQVEIGKGLKLVRFFWRSAPSLSYGSSFQQRILAENKNAPPLVAKHKGVKNPQSKGVSVALRIHLQLFLQEINLLCLAQVQPNAMAWFQVVIWEHGSIHHIALMKQLKMVKDYKKQKKLPITTCFGTAWRHVGWEQHIPQ